MSAQAERRTETIPAWKREEVDALVAFIEAYETIGIIDVTGIPSRQFQQMRADLHGTAAVRMSRNTLIERALDDVDDGLEALTAYVDGQVGLIGTNANPFGLFQQLEASKTAAPINAGEVAPNEIVIEAGDTGLDPGPFVGDLQTVGAAAQIMEGSIQVTEDSVVAEQGDVVSDDLAGVLAELGIEPKEVGLDLRAAFSDGVVFEADDLGIDIDAYRDDVIAAAGRARNLSLNAAVPTGRTIRALLGIASGDAKAVGLAAEIESPEILGQLVSKADGQVRALAAHIADEDALPEELRDLDEPPTGTETETETDTDTEPDDPEAEPDAAADEPDDDDDDDVNAAGEGLGDMFG